MLDLNDEQMLTALGQKHLKLEPGDRKLHKK